MHLFNSSKKSYELFWRLFSCIYETMLYAIIAWFKQLHDYSFNRHLKETHVPQMFQFLYKKDSFLLIWSLLFSDINKPACQYESFKEVVKRSYV